MPVDSRGLFDVYQELIIDALKTYEASQYALNPNVGFEIMEDVIRNPEFKKDESKYTKYVPIVCVYTPNITPGNGTVNKMVHEECEYTIEMVVKSVGDEDDYSEQLAYRRLRYLIQQVKNAIYRLDQSHFGKKIKELAKKSWPSVTTFATMEDKQEESIAGAVMRFTLTLPYYAPGVVNSTPADNNDPVNQLLEIINVNAKYFTAEYYFNG